ncbi:ubiquitin-specific protease 23 isoform X2 [Tasmannia lanceolata]|uniref:ubiquitin-specific protease 23 isoform X2 n=1 Tax=Tasmannia lanceolata TaxID=3420 RepID=UPI0040638054
MAESLISIPETKKPLQGFSLSLPNGSLFPRRIDFHLATKPFSSYTNNASDGFHLETLNPTSDSKRPAVTSSGNLSGPVKSPDGGGDVFEHGLDSELSFRITFRRIGAGLANLGNTCFLNSVLQCLTYTEPFAAYLQSGKHKSSCHTSGFCAMCAIQNHVSSALQSTGKILSPSHLVKNLRCISRSFRNCRQEDAHEYMVNLLESMHKCCLPYGVSSESPSAYEKSLVHKIFGGRLRSQVKCMQCSYCSNTFDPFLDLSLEIVRADSLRKALAHFTAAEKLDGGERQYRCQRCKEKVKALKQLTVHKAPYVLTIHLKRFGSEVPGQKIDKKVDFGTNLDLKPFVSDPHEGEWKYTLYGVLVHAGWTTHSGHYFCFVRTSTGMWYALDDKRVSQVSEKTVLEQKAYMLFYVRDKRISAPKKPLDVIRNNVVTNTAENKELAVSASGSKGTFQNGQTERRSSESVGIASSKDHLLKEEPRLHKNGHASKDLSLGDHLLKEPLLNGPLLRKPSVSQAPNTYHLAEGRSHSVPVKENGNGTTSYLDDATVATESAKSYPENLHHTCNGNIEGTSNAPRIQVAEQKDCNGFQEHLPFEKPLTENVKHENGVVTESGQSNSPCNRVSVLNSEKFGAVKLTNQSSPENGCIHQKSLDRNCEKCRIHGQNGYNINGMRPSDPPCQKSGENDINSGEIVSMGSSILSGDVRCCVQKKNRYSTHSEAKSHGHHHRMTKPKKFMKFPAIKSLHIASKRLFLSSLSIRKRKKHKRSKRHSSCISNLTVNDFIEPTISSDHGTSTSEKAKMVDRGSTDSQSQRSHSVSNKRNGYGNTKETKKEVNNCNGDSVSIKERELRERNGHSPGVPSTSETQEKCSSSEAKQCDARKSDVQEKTMSTQKGIMSMLIRGLEDRTVARWDDIESPSTEIHMSNGSRNYSIGYVPDEWDEEYDKGKRKKVRKSSSAIDGQNLFQEVATKKAKMKKMKRIDQDSAGNLPFRI